jgi:hypothetical protein
VAPGDKAAQMLNGTLEMLLAEYDFTTNLPIVEQDPKIVKMQFETPVCMTDYLEIEKNKYGIIRVGDRDTWIKELKYVENGVSEITVVAEDFLC